MDLLVRLLAVFLCCGIRAQSNLQTLRVHSPRSLYGFENGFEPIAFAAVPLQQPMPLIRIVSPTPAYKHKFGAQYGAEVQPTRNYLYHQPIYPADISSTLESEGTEPLESSELEQQTSEVIYARPNKGGGYTYRKPARPRRPTPDPIIIRVHKYKVVRDR